MLNRNKMKYIGVDGCRAGWFAIALNGDSFEFQVFKCIEELWEKYQDARLILIDMPIGLGKSAARECDRMARTLLKNRASSVFNTPCREALKGKDHSDASRIHQKVTGKKISIQTYNIMHKIRQLDTFLISNSSARKRFRETHPEICFYKLSGRQLRYNKKKDEGFKERINILNKIYPLSKEIVNSAMRDLMRKDVARDDIVDALVNAVTAKLGYKNMTSIIKPIQKDDMGLPMTMWYYSIYDNIE